MYQVNLADSTSDLLINQVVNRRFKIFGQQHVPLYTDLGDAMIGTPNQAHPRHAVLEEDRTWGIVMHGSRLLVGKG